MHPRVRYPKENDITEYLLQNQKSANSHQHLSMNTPQHTSEIIIIYAIMLFRLDIPRSVVTYTSNIFFLELSGFGYAPTH